MRKRLLRLLCAVLRAVLCIVLCTLLVLAMSACQGEQNPSDSSGSEETGKDTTAPVTYEPGEVIVKPDEKGYTYPMLLEDLAVLEVAFGEHFFYESIGQSVDGREIFACVVGNPAAPKKIMITGGIHGREYLSSLLVMMQIEHYLTEYDTGEHNGLSYRAGKKEYFTDK